MKYRHIFFDLDHTLWDFDRNSTESLCELYHQYQLHTFDFREEDFVQHFLSTNYRLWDLYNAGTITQQELRNTRFQLVFEALGVAGFPHCGPLGEDYLRISPQKPHLLPYAKELLDYLRDRYVLHLITNGFSDIQGIKTNSSGITAYFREVITSERSGYKKPHRQMFDFALRAVDTPASECIMIGDSWECDIVGARNAGIDQIFYNPGGLEYDSKPTYEVRCLSEIITLL